MNRELPSLDESRCTGCGDCIAACPAECLAVFDAVVWLPRPRDCIACQLCCLICPETALQMAPWTPA